MARTVTVRIAVCVNAAEEWSAYGHYDEDDDSVLMQAHHEVGDAVSWVTAEVVAPEPHPEPQEIRGEVEDA